MQNNQIIYILTNEACENRKNHLYYSILFILLTVLFAACSRYPSPSENEATIQDIQKVFADYGGIGKLLPPRPEKALDDGSINGVDMNNNQVRDYIEAILPQFLPLVSEKSKNIELYARVLSIIRDIQPIQEEKVIDLKKFYCQYASLPQELRDRTSMGMLQDLVMDTVERKKRFSQQVINTSGSMSAEECIL